MKPRIREVIIVEGRYDKNTVMQAVDATVIETRGFGIFSDDELAALIRRMAKERGVVLFTDSDGAGSLIRGRLRGMLGGIDVKNAYTPDVPGRERRKSAPSKAGMLGVEGMSREIIVESLRRSGATFENGGGLHRGAGITKTDMYSLGLSGTADASKRREALRSALGFPSVMSPNALREALSCLYDREELERELMRLGLL